MIEPLRFNEGKACDAVVRHLERREASARTNVRFPDRDRHLAPVELVCTIGSQTYAIEHTGIEPFAGHMRANAEAARLIQPIVAGVDGHLPPEDDFELQLPVRAMEALRSRNVSTVQDHIIKWVVATAQGLRKPTSGRKDVTPWTSDAAGIPFALRLYRLSGFTVRPGQLQIVHVVSNLEAERADRIAAALAKKAPKLAIWKRDERARTVLVLEENDIQLTNSHVVTEAVLAYEARHGHAADEIYLVTTSFAPWHVHHVQVGTRSYFDLTDPDERSWDADPSDLASLTGR
jgi:hypothetical protein